MWMYDPGQFGTASQNSNLNSRLIGVHYVTPSRNMLKAALESAPAATVNAADRDIEEIRFRSPKPFGLFGATLVVARSLAARPSAG
jgi:hypothetical protein